jgi:quercetin dioxygenase-like cupin family protein
MSKRTSPDGRGATSKQQSNIANFTETLAAIERGRNNPSMKSIFSSALVMLLVVAFSSTRLSGEETQSSEMRFYPPTSVEWKPGPAAIPAGAKMAVLEGDPTKEGPFVVRFQFPDGYHIPPHTHPKTERVTVLSGNLYLATGEILDRDSAKKLPAGSFGYWPAGMKHAAWSEGETVIQLHGIGPWQINYVNPADDPRNAKKSL